MVESPKEFCSVTAAFLGGDMFAAP
jgi:hypothetical protein